MCTIRNVDFKNQNYKYSFEEYIEAIRQETRELEELKEFFEKNNIDFNMNDLAEFIVLDNIFEVLNYLKKTKNMLKLKKEKL